jgi:predicted ATPase
MRLERLKIKKFRNLKNFEIKFTDSAIDVDGNKRVLKSHAVIGQNGSGKSNMIEAIVTIFRDLDLNQHAAFSYELDYQIREYSIQIKAEQGFDPDIVINGEKHDAWEVSDTYHFLNNTAELVRGKGRRYLPSNIFTYYSGKNDRLEALFKEHQESFIQNINDFEDAPQDSDALVRRLFYCRHPHSKLVLLACLLAPEKPLKELLDDMQIDEVDSALFVLKQPYRLMGDVFTEEDIKQGNKNFWYDQTRFSEEFLNKLWDVSIAPIDRTESKTIDFRGRVEDQELLYLFVDTSEKLQELKEHIGDSYRFFRFLEGSYVADLLDDVKIFVKHRKTDGLLLCDQLSEGEMQLLTVLGLMRLTHQDHCLFLLDEPDTHLNPIWKLRYFDQINKVLEQDSDDILKGDSQIIVTTHDPIMIGSLRKEQVRILRKNKQGNIEVQEPEINPQGMGFEGLLKSELFGLRSTVDTETLRRLDRRNFLFAKGEARSNAETDEMRRLSDELADLGFAKDFKDPYYARFVQKLAQHTKFHKVALSPEEQKEQDRIANEIIDEILAEDGAK